MIRTLSTMIAALAIAACGGTAFFFLHMPLPWTLGALTATAIVAIAGGRWLVPMQTRIVVRPVIGVLAGSAFTAELATAILGWGVAVLIVAGYALVMLFLGFAFFRKIGGFDGTTAFFASAPGGLGELSLIGGSLGADMRHLVVVHLIRILIVVFTVPFALQILLGTPIGRTVPTAAAASALSPVDWGVLTLCAVVGFGISRIVRFPSGPMFFPLILSMTVHVSGITHAAPPPWLVALAQVTLGAVIGARFAGTRWHEARNTILIGLVWGVGMLAMAAAFALPSAWLLDIPFETMLLALAPGGMVEMTLITYALGADVAFVVTCQLARVLLVLILTPVLFRLLGIHLGGPGGSSPSALE